MIHPGFLPEDTNNVLALPNEHEPTHPHEIASAQGHLNAARLTAFVRHPGLSARAKSKSGES
jgi:hypothetical protein